MSTRLTILLAGNLESDTSISMKRYLRQVRDGLQARSEEVDMRVLRPAGGGARSRLLRAAVRRLTYPAEVRRQLRRPQTILHVIDHFYAYLLPAAGGVATCHDLAEFNITDLSPEQLVRWKARVAALKRAAHVFADSEATAEDLRKFVGLERSRITVNYLGADPIFSPIPAGGSLQPRVAALRERARGAPLVLHVGNNLRRKNVPVLLEALAILRRQGIPAMLVKAGEPLGGGDISAWNLGRKGGDPELQSQVARLGLHDAILEVDSVTDRELVEIYNVCTLLSYPSLFEGFGYPVVEAQACGLPCVLSNTSSLPEVGGDAALYHDPRDASALARAIAMLTEQPDVRGEMSRKGLENVRRFSWHAHVDRLIDVYQRLARPEGARHD
jgi:glycosyltransferase involved in cell wall biosynthesis